MKKIGRTIPFVLLSVIAVTTAAATVVESIIGSDAAKMLIYNAGWYMTLWVAVCVAGLWLILKRRMWKNPPTMLLHVSLMIILLGATLTHFTSKNGFVHVREKEAVHEFWIRTENGKFLTNEILPFYICLNSFHIEYDENDTTPKDYVSEVILATRKGNIPTTISMNHIGRISGYRIYQTSYDEDLHGSIFTIQYDPWGIAITYAGYALLALSMLLISIRKKTTTEQPRNNHVPTILTTIVGIVFALYMVVAIALRPLMPVLRSPMLVIHVGVIMISYCLLIVSIVNRKVLRTAVFLLAAGIFLGAVWANMSWGTYWSWDPKESWALVTLIVYSLPLHTESLPWFRSEKHYRIYSILALLSLLMTYFGVNYILGGMHSYMG